MSFTICSVGCGRLATEMHGPSLALYRSRRTETRLAACCDLDAQRAARFRDSFGYEASYTDLQAMLRKERPDAVNVVVPPAMTAAVAIAVLGSGAPVIMEKPPGLTASETRQIIAAARRYGLPARVAFNRRWMPVTARLMSILAGPPAVGIEHIHYDFYRVGRTDPDFSTTAIHPIDLVRFIARSDYRSIRFLRGRSRRPLVEDLFLDCTLASGATARISCCPASGVEMERVTVSAKDLTVVAELPGWEPPDPPGGITRYESHRPGQRLSEEEIDPARMPFERLGFHDENASFFDELRAGVRPGGGVEEAMQVVQIAEAVRAGADTWQADE